MPNAQPNKPDSLLIELESIEAKNAVLAAVKNSQTQNTPPYPFDQIAHQQKRLSTDSCSKEDKKPTKHSKPLVTKKNIDLLFEPTC